MHAIKEIAPRFQLRQCWNCHGTGEGLVFNESQEPGAPLYVPGPCVACSGRGQLAAND